MKNHFIADTEETCLRRSPLAFCRPEDLKQEAQGEGTQGGPQGSTQL